MKIKLLFISICMTRTVLASSPCPTTMVWAILTNNSKIVELLLEIGEDPNASLEECQIEVNKGIATIATFMSKRRNSKNYILDIIQRNI